MADRGVVPVFLCPFSPDLNPIEALWDRMKDILGALHPEIHRNSKRLKAAVWEAWEAITGAEVRELARTMNQRCQDVKDANGMYTSW
jgi:hypothetical protein